MPTPKNKPSKYQIRILHLMENHELKSYNGEVAKINDESVSIDSIISMTEKGLIKCHEHKSYYGNLAVWTRTFWGASIAHYIG